jgi:hypothetical protein
MPFGNGGYTSGLAPSLPPRGTGGGGADLALDNMLRNQLRVSDPRNPQQIAEGLLAFYKDLPQAVGIRQEAQGLPFLQAPTTPVMQPAQPTSSDAEFNIANGDVEKALLDLASNPLTNDITPEMQGWGDSIRSAVAQGRIAAQQGLDPTQRDKVIGIRRQLGEYARMARFVGSLSPGMTQNYRRLAQGLDEVAAVLLVMLGESLASVGFASGYYLLQVPLAELQQRRDSVVLALRNFMGGAQQAYGPDDWPRGIDAYRRLYNWLEEQGQGDLRSLLIENEIARIMDALITRAQNGSPQGLRALGVTAQLDVERFRRMTIVGRGAIPDRSPPLEAYLQALELFAETFRPAGGLRLLRIARPAILFYGLYNPNLLENDQDLLQLIIIRGYLATAFDSILPSAGARSVEPQVLLDMLVMELDRGLDLLALGPQPAAGGKTERRAICYWLIVRVIRQLLLGYYAPVGGNPVKNPLPGPLSAEAALDPNFEGDLVRIAATYAGQSQVLTRLNNAFAKYDAMTIFQPPPAGQPLPIGNPNLLPLPQDVQIAVREELQVQEALEERWRKLVGTVAPEAGDQEGIFRLLDLVIKQAMADVALAKLPGQLRLPPQFEESLERIARWQR